MDGMFGTLAAILWLGNVDFTESGGEDEGSKLTHEDEESLVKVGNLLGLELTQLKYILLNRQIIVRGNVTEIPFKLSEVRMFTKLSGEDYSETFRKRISKLFRNISENKYRRASQIVSVILRHEGDSHFDRAASTSSSFLDE